MATEFCQNPDCGERVTLNNKTCRLVRFKYQAWFDHFLVSCPHCGNTARSFAIPATIQLYKSKIEDLFVLTYDYAWDNVIEAANDFNGIQLLEPHELDASDEARVAYFQEDFEEWLNGQFPEF